MGDMADFFLESVDNHEDMRLAWKLGDLSLEDALDEGIIDEWGSELGPLTGAPKTCRCCAQSGLVWGNFHGKWLLCTNAGDLHVCPVNPYDNSRPDAGAGVEQA